MFAGFNIKIDKSFFDKLDKSFLQYKEIGETHLSDQRTEYGKLKNYIVSDIVDGSKIQGDYFPLINADIFISHSHDDKDLAQALAGWINYTFGLKCFIDSDVWGYVDNLLEELNTKYSNRRKRTTGGYLYDYRSSNKVSQHVNIMLLVALQKMIDNTEAVFLLNTGNSIKIADGKNIDLTYSPWIYSEIVCTQIVRNKPLILYRDYSCSHKPLNENTQEYKKNLIVSYTVSLKHLKDLNSKKMYLWESKKYKNVEYKLDGLYELMYPEELEKTKLAFQNINLEDIKMIKDSYYNNNRSENLNFICESFKKQQRAFCCISDGLRKPCCSVCFEKYCPCCYKDKSIEE